MLEDREENNHSSGQGNTEISPDGIEAKAEEETLYDADAQQRIQVLALREIDEVLKSYKVIHTIKSCQDEDYITFDKNCKVRVHSYPDRSIETFDEAKAAAVLLYKSLKTKVKGWGPEDGSKVDEEQMHDVILKNYLVTAIVTPEQKTAITGNADEDKPWEVKQSSSIYSIELRCLFNGREVTTQHFIRPTNANQKERFEGLTNRRKYEAGARLRKNDVIVPSIAKPLGKIYDERMEQVQNYHGRVPLWHKVAVIYSDYQREDDPEAGEA